MIKFTASVGDKTLIGFGFSDANLKLLREGNPVLVDLDQLNIPGGYEILIFYGGSEQSMMDDLRNNIDQDTIIHHGEGKPN